jgi:hypothetical protein
VGVAGVERLVLGSDGRTCRRRSRAGCPKTVSHHGWRRFPRIPPLGAALADGHILPRLDTRFTGSVDTIRHPLDQNNWQLLRHDVTFALDAEVDTFSNLASPPAPIHHQPDPL